MRGEGIAKAPFQLFAKQQEGTPLTPLIQQTTCQPPPAGDERDGFLRYSLRSQVSQVGKVNSLPARAPSRFPSVGGRAQQEEAPLSQGPQQEATAGLWWRFGGVVRRTEPPLLLFSPSMPSLLARL